MNLICHKKIFSFLLPLLLLAAGIYLFPLRIFENDFSKIPGDLGDARFNNYILEHGHNFCTGKVDNYWDAPFMYPYKNVIAFSDNLLGTVPFYSAFRIAGADRETAFQCWFLALFVLNFICCFWALNKWSNNYVLSSVGAYIFAFSIFNLGQLGHAQVFPRFIVPLVFYWSWKFLSGKEMKYFLFASLGLVYQFYCGIYLGFLLIYVLMFMLIAYFIVYRDKDFFSRLWSIRNTAYCLIIIFIAGALLLPLMIPYINISQIIGMRKFDEVVDTIPRLRSYFFASPASLTWSFLYGHSAYGFPSWWNHFLFPGVIPWISILAVPFVLKSAKTGREGKKFLAFISLGFFLSFIFCLNINGYTLYRIIFELPGFSSMRSLDRLINIEIVFFVLIFVFVFKELSFSNKIFKGISYGFPLLIIADNYFVPEHGKIGRFDKWESQKKINMVKKIVKDNFEKQFTAIAFVPLNFYSKGAEDKNAFLLETHINVMLATQELNIPCVNAYTGYSPGNFSHFFRKPDDETLCYWIKYNKTDFNIVQRINELDKKEKYRKPIHLKAPNGKFVCVDERLNNLVFANREKAGAWETFSLICFENNENALLAHSNFFLSEASIEQDNISANATKISEYELFSIIESASNLVSFKGPNNQFLSMDESTFQIAAKADSIGENEKFIMINEFENDKKIIDKYEIYIKAYNNKYVCADESFNNIVIANREEVGGWETFLLILFENNRCALRAGSGLFLSTELNEDGAVFAINEGINAREMFSLIEFDNSFVAFEAANGKYLSFDEKTLRIMANANSSGRKEKFLMKKYLKD